MHRTRQTSDRTVSAPAQLRLHGASITPLSAHAPVAPVAPVTPAAPVAPAASTPSQSLGPKTKLREAFEGLEAKSTRANVRLLPRNTDAWLGVWDVLETAPAGIDASYFILERDIFGMAFLGSLLKKAQEGQPVRLLVDSSGDFLRRKGFTLPGAGADYLQELVAYGAEVRIYHPLHKKILRNLLGQVKGFGRIASNHDKLVRSDTKAQTGGRNMARDYLAEPENMKGVYRDTCVQIESADTSKEFKRAFEREFYQKKITFKMFEDLFGNWRKRDGELLGAYTMMKIWLDADHKLSPHETNTLRASEAYRNKKADELLEETYRRLPEVGFTRKPSWLTRRSLRKRARELVGYPDLFGSNSSFAKATKVHENVELKVLDRTSAAAEAHDNLTDGIRTAAKSAQKRLRIHNPYLVLSEQAIESLEEAGRRGVEIELMTNSPDSTDSVLTQGFFLEDWPRLLARIPNLRLFVLSGNQKLHGKTIEVDGMMTFVKSYNLDLLSEKVNSELGVVAWDEGLAKEAQKMFDRDVQNPDHVVREYLIKRDARGEPVYVDGEPVVAYGARDHISPKKWGRYKIWRWVARQLRKLPALADVQRPSLATLKESLLEASKALGQRRTRTSLSVPRPQISGGSTPTSERQNASS